VKVVAAKVFPEATVEGRQRGIDQQTERSTEELTRLLSLSGHGSEAEKENSHSHIPARIVHNPPVKNPTAMIGFGW